MKFLLSLWSAKKAKELKIAVRQSDDVKLSGMETESLTTLLVLILGGLICAAIHWLIGVAQRRIVRRYTTQPLPGSNALPSLKTLMLDWLCNGLRTLVWVIYFSVLVQLLPDTRSQIRGVGTRLRRLRENIFDWLMDRGLNVIIIIVVTIFLMRFAAALVRTIFVLMERGAAARDEAATRRRLQTLSAIFSGAAQSAIFFIGLMTLLQQLHVNITPILASAGVVGIAVGFGAQSLIKDLFSGFLILLEDQFSVGDTVKIGEFSGIVEQITLRATRIRGMDGALTTIPNGNIANVSNLSKDWSRVVLDVEIDYNENVDQAMQIAIETAHAYRAEIPHEIIEEPSMLGVDKMSYTSVTLRMMVKTAPARQFDIGRELRRRIKLAYEQHGVKTPLAKQQLLMPEELASAISETDAAKKN